MRIEELKYFVVIADCHSMTRASTVLHVSQQCVSRAIRQFEMELGVQLFIRSQKGVTLTKEGEIAYRESKKILKQIYRLSNLFEKKENYNLNLGCFMGLSEAVNSVIDFFDYQGSSLTINNIFFSTERLEEEIEQKNIDIAIRQVEACDFEKVIDNINYNHVVLLKEPVELLMNAACVEKGMSIFYLHTLKYYPILFYSSTSTEVPLFERIAQRYGPLHVIYKGNDRDRSWKLFKENNAVALFTRSMYNSTKDESHQSIRKDTRILKLDEQILIYTVLSVKKSLCDNKCVLKLIGAFNDYFQEL